MKAKALFPILIALSASLCSCGSSSMEACFHTNCTAMGLIGKGYLFDKAEIDVGLANREEFVSVYRDGEPPRQSFNGVYDDFAYVPDGASFALVRAIYDLDGKRLAYDVYDFSSYFDVVGLVCIDDEVNVTDVGGVYVCSGFKDDVDLGSLKTDEGYICYGVVAFAVNEAVCISQAEGNECLRFEKGPTAVTLFPDSFAYDLVDGVFDFAHQRFEDHYSYGKTHRFETFLVG